LKGEDKLDDPVVLAKKDSAKQMALDNDMVYFVISGKKVGEVKSRLNL